MLKNNLKQFNFDMLKIDLHIHTIKSEKDSSDINFSIEKLQKYIDKNKLNIIGITNHDLFGKEQFLKIKNEIKNCLVFMGVEISLEGTHILLFSNEDILEFDSKIKRLKEKLILNKKDKISFENFKEIFSNLSKYIIIPHYKKEPSISSELISKFENDIKLVEVSNWKKFNLVEKEGKFLPVIFSDKRIDNDQDLNGKFTYLNLNKNKINSFKNFYDFIKSDKIKTYHSPLLEKNFFY